METLILGIRVRGDTLAAVATGLSKNRNVIQSKPRLLEKLAGQHFKVPYVHVSDCSNLRYTQRSLL